MIPRNVAWGGPEIFQLLKRHLEKLRLMGFGHLNLERLVIFLKRFDMPKVRTSAAAPVGVISKVLRILEAIQGAPSGLGLKATSELTGIHKSTAHRFLKHLERENYLISTEDGAYLIGRRFWQMTAHVNYRAALQAVARPILWDLWKATQETVNLAVLDHETVLYADVIESPHEFRLATRVG